MKHRLLFVMVLSCVLLFSSCQSAPTNPPAISADPAPLSSSQLKDMQKEYPFVLEAVLKLLCFPWSCVIIWKKTVS